MLVWGLAVIIRWKDERERAKALLAVAVYGMERPEQVTLLRESADQLEFDWRRTVKAAECATRAAAGGI